MTLELDYNGSSVTIGNFYGPNTDNTRAIDDFLTKIDEYDNTFIILGGDFNFCLDITKDRESSARRVSNHEKSKQALKTYMVENDLIDLWRELNPQKRLYTCLRLNPPSKSRIDFFLTSRGVLFTQKSPQASIRDGYLSDHRMVTVSVHVPIIGQGRSFWKFNNDLLKDENFVAMVRRKIKEIILDNQNSIASKVTLFETLLCVLRGHVIQFASYKKRKSRENLEKLERDILNLQDNPDSDAREIEALVEQRDTLIHEITSKRMFQSRARWRELAETGSKYFHELQKRNKRRNICTALFVKDKGKDGQEVVTNNTDDMLEEGREFFEELYRQRSVAVAPDSFIAGLPRLSREDTEHCNSPLDIDEVRRAVFSTRNNTSPGPSGYTGEFYKFFWPELNQLIHLAICEIFESRNMPVNIKRSITILIPKKGKDSRMLSNLRPISLLNTFYKIITKCLALRLANVINHLINNDQTGFIKGRFIGENIRLLLDLKAYCISHNYSALLLACDVKKAYDCVDWQYMKHVLSAAGLGNNFLRWIDVLYDRNTQSPTTAAVQINGKISRDYKIERGLRQGCPLSCLLFLIVFEPLLERIRRCEAIKGVNINNTDIKITSFADDVTVIMNGSSQSMLACLTIFEDFKTVSGLELNVSKTQALWIGHAASSKQPICTDFNIQWPKGCIEILGVKIPNDPEVNISSLNYDAKFENIIARLTPWAGRGLTPFGRIYLIKSELLSQLIYLMTVLPSPSLEFVKKLESAFFKFIWGGKKDRIKRATLKAKYKDGGLQVPDVISQSNSLKIAWVRKYMDVENKAKWKDIMKEKLHLGRDTTVFHCDSNPDTIKKWLKSKFWEEACSAWMVIKKAEENSGGNILAKVIWGNRDIKAESNQSISRQLLITKGLLRIADLYNVSERKLLTANEIARKYSIHPILALSILRAIPDEWKQRISREKPAELVDPECFNTLRSSSKTAKWTYWILEENAHPLVTEKCHEKWKLELYPTLSPQMQWSAVYTRLKRSTRDVNLRWIQYRIIKRILPTQRLLYLFGITESDKCKKCPMYSETIIHKFYSCPSVRTLWLGVRGLLGTQINITGKDVILGIRKSNLNEECWINTTIMLTNQFIWKYRDRQECLTLENLKFHICDYLKVEHYIAKINDTESQFVDRWGSLIQRL